MSGMPQRAFRYTPRWFQSTLRFSDYWNRLPLKSPLSQGFMNGRLFYGRESHDLPCLVSFKAHYSIHVGSGNWSNIIYISFLEKIEY